MQCNTSTSPVSTSPDASLMSLAFFFPPPVWHRRVQVATRLGKETDSSAPRGESSPLRRKIKTFGKAVVAAMSRESSCASDAGSSNVDLDEGGKGSCRGQDGAEVWGVLPQSPLKGKAKATAGMGDDFGVELSDLSW